MRRIVCGHHHRPIVTQVAHAVASICPSVAHQVELTLEPKAPPAFVLEPAAFEIHLWREATGFVSHPALLADYPGYTPPPVGASV